MIIHPITPQDIEMLTEWLECDPIAGTLRWKKKLTRKTVVGAVAGCARPGGYIAVQLNKRRFLVHRAIYAMCNGECLGEIDHINGNPSDNRLCNLRVVSRSQQNMNKAPSRKNKLNLAGVTYYARINKFNARIRAYGQRVSLGYFNTVEEAHAAYRDAVKKYHGEYGRAF